MTYTPTVWQTGDVITAEKLNHMEDGSFMGVFFSASTENEHMVLKGLD